MATKKTKSGSAKPGKAEVTKLRTELATAESKRDKWKKRAVKAETAAADLQARLKRAEKRLKKARKADAAAAPATSSEVPPDSAAVSAPSTRQVVATVHAPDAKAPDASWTVAALRAEARRRGIAGMSRKSKADLLSALA